MSGWLIGVMVELADAPAAQRWYFAVGHEDRAKAEWTAIDSALRLGGVATSPVGGLEPVQAIAPIPAQKMKTLGLSAGQVRDLGWKWPRRWIPSGAGAA